MVEQSNVAGWSEREQTWRENKREREAERGRERESERERENAMPAGMVVHPGIMAAAP